MMTVNKIRVRNLAEAGLSHAVVLEKILSNQPKMLSAILIGNDIVNISASSLMTVLSQTCLEINMSVSEPAF